MYRAQRTCLVAVGANVGLFPLNEIKKLQQNVVLSECTVRYRVAY